MISLKKTLGFQKSNAGLPMMTYSRINFCGMIQKVLLEGVNFFDNFFLVDERIQIPLLIPPLTSFRWLADGGPTLNAGLVAL